ncbi:GerAB/ArcD/ProY family transporter [Paenibacillus sp. OV219]|uniref:GerAB/ArcD/ProY family transporter n=1 Tax=Paenibacillus sp. OV219 TaxID=1884377 RepID=UPI0008BA28AF|nr:GerAB/ArcD/ProY family transporter [Paenibacillus sp. OV219]SEN15699.1 spore germination protein (amino acid permease) [Paenibacillus sp. OV219]
MIHLEKLSLKQLFWLVVLTQVGVHVLTIPFEESKHTGYDSWMSVIIGGAMAQVVILIIYQLGKRYADRPLPQYMSAITGKLLGAVLNVVFALYFAESSLMVVVSYADVLRRWVLFTTPWSVIIGFSFAIAAYIATSSLRSIAVITQTITIMFLLCFMIVVISGLGRGDLRNFMPLGTHGIGPILKDALPAFWAYAGYELLLYTFPFVKCRKKKDILITMSVANGFTTLFYMLLSFLATYSFSESQLKAVPEPMIFILRQFRWPTVQNLDIVFMTIWLSVTTVTVYVYLFMAARYLAYIRSKEIRNHPLLVWIVAFACFLIGIWGSDRQWISRFTLYHDTVSILILAGIPAFLLLVSLVRNKKAAIG